jgi:hypothetical protein
VFGGAPNTARETHALPTHFSAFQKRRIRGARKISDYRKYFGNISEKQPFSEKISDYFFRGSASVPVAVRRVSRRTFGAKWACRAVAVSSAVLSTVVLTKAEAVAAKAGQTGAFGQNARQILCNYFMIKILQLKCWPSPF